LNAGSSSIIANPTPVSTYRKVQVESVVSEVSANPESRYLARVRRMNMNKSSTNPSHSIADDGNDLRHRKDLMAQTDATTGVKNIVLVHGGFVDGSGWEGV
jgi:hypothetical protein